MRGVVDGQQAAQAGGVGVGSVLQQEVDAVWVPRICSIAQDAVTVGCPGVDVGT